MQTACGEALMLFPYMAVAWGSGSQTMGREINLYVSQDHKTFPISLYIFLLFNFITGHEGLKCYNAHGKVWEPQI